MLGQCPVAGTFPGAPTQRTLAALLVGAVLAVGLSVAAQGAVDALPALALELAGRAQRAVLLVAVVLALGEAVAAPRHRDAVHLTCETGELLRGARWWLFGNQADKQKLKIQVNKLQIGAGKDKRAQLLSH